MARILVVEDEENLRLSIRRALGRAGHTVAEAAGAPDAWRETRGAEFDVVLTDINLGGGETGVDFLRRLREEGFEGVVIVMTAYGTVENAVAAMKEGADDYIQKPVSLEELTLLVTRTLENRRLKRRLRLYERLERTRADESAVIGESRLWKAAVVLAERLASMPLPQADGESSPPRAGLPTILLLGETGAGKGVLARHIHQLAQRSAAAHHAGANGGSSDTPFVHVNCSALPATLVESELFGHEKGAFTDAKSARPGLFEMAEGGTILLDEIGDMPPDLQAKLLLVVEHGAYRRVGGARERAVNARVITATNQDLEKRVEDGRFRRDLYYRLNAFTIRIPALRERGDDILLIAEAMLARFTREYGRQAMRLSPTARIALVRHSWPGNVRELVNVMQRAVMLCDTAEIGPDDMGLSAQAVRKASTAPLAPAAGESADPGHPTPLRFDFERGVHTAEEVERALITQALEHARGNVSRAAKLIGMNRSSFRYRLERAGLTDYAQEVAKE